MSEEILGEVIDENIQSILENVHTALPGQVVFFDGTLATVKPGMLKQFKDFTILPYPEITGVPVCFPRTLRSGLVFDLLPGDFGLIVFAERNIDNWALSGLPSIPADSGKFNLNDAFFIPGIFPKTTPELNYAPLTTTLYRNDVGLVNFKNITESFAKLMQDTITAISSITTFGSPASHIGTPTWIATMTAIAVRWAALSGIT